jgi:hypothetical protein
MLSTPPAITTSASPSRIARAAWFTAVSPLAHSRLTVKAGTVVGEARQQSRHTGYVAVVLARLVGAAEHDLVDPLGVDAGLRRATARTTSAARSSGRTSARAPRWRPMGVRTAATITGSRS